MTKIRKHWHEDGIVIFDGTKKEINRYSSGMKAGAGLGSSSELKL